MHVLTQQPNDQLQAAQMQGENKHTKTVKEDNPRQKKSKVLQLN
jgi:hypothetical protein